MTTNVLEGLRRDIIDEVLTELPDEAVIAQRVIDKVTEYFSFNLKSVINGTGIIIHTNLGRSMLSREVNQQLMQINAGYSNLEYDLHTGKRGLRYSHIEEILKDLTGAEAALVVNNNAAAVMLVLSTLAFHKEVVVSRGELVEIGGSFRVPEVMKISGGTLVEVGTTNKTHLKDFKNALNENTGAILKVHTSNYKIMGFTKEVPVEDLVALGREAEIPFVFDLGSGTLVDLERYGLSKEPTVLEQVEKDIDVITFSGDKLLGGPQCGVIIGKKVYIDAIKNNQLTRALRVDKMTIAALEATLRYYLDESLAIEKIPTLRMITESFESVNGRAQELLKMIVSENVHIITGTSQVGGGTYPLDEIPSALIAVNPGNLGADKFAEALRNRERPIIVRINDDKVLLDVRTLQNEDFKYIAGAIDEVRQWHM
jgi:L-seryl-tRNA(Ser) seleniumtransferase